MIIRMKFGRGTPKFFKGVRSNFVASCRAAARDIAEEFQLNLKAEAPRWRGYLRRTIMVESPNKNQYNVKMAYYGVDVEKGHTLTYPQGDTSKLKKWVADGGRQRTPERANAWYWGKVVARPESGRTTSTYNTIPNRFISRAWRFTKDAIPSIIQSRVSGGRR